MDNWLLCCCVLHDVFLLHISFHSLLGSFFDVSNKTLMTWHQQGCEEQRIMLKLLGSKQANAS